ncbi:aldo/keto reductase [Aerococcaceae bacterium DSM 111021]|nr:aldo/keto reductase [Aerococcaceae bacterium DSM 111021]
MPILVFGVFQIGELDECERVVGEAIEVGYRSIDTAQSYGNEEAAGNAIAKSGVSFVLCEELGIGFVAYGPLGTGFLSGKYSSQKEFGNDDYRSFMGRFKPEVMENKQAVLDLLSSIAEDKGATSAQIVLAWELAQKDFIVPIPGTTKIHRVEENLGAMKIEFTQKELAAIDSVLADLEVDTTYY